MNPADRFAQLPDLLAADTDLRRRGRWLDVDCRIDIGAEPFFLSPSARAASRPSSAGRG